MPTNAKVGISSCAILRRTPTAHYDFVLLSAGTNDPPGRCIEAIRARLNASRVAWVVPVNGARKSRSGGRWALWRHALYYTPASARGPTQATISRCCANERASTQIPETDPRRALLDEGRQVSRP